MLQIIHNVVGAEFGSKHHQQKKEVADPGPAPPCSRRKEAADPGPDQATLQDISPSSVRSASLNNPCSQGRH